VEDMKKFKKSIVVILSAIFVVSLALAVSTPVLAITSANDLFGGSGIKDNMQATLGLGNRDPRELAASIINVILGFLGIIAVVIIMLAGFKWMTAGGNEDKITEAKGLMTAGFIGLIIILASWGLATWVVTLLYNQTQ
jgi:hypothetical protein